MVQHLGIPASVAVKDRARNSIRGGQAQAAGSHFEAFIERHHNEGKRLGIIAHVAHNEPRSKVIGGRLIYESAGVSDYTAVLEQGARAAAIEAKSRKGTCLGKSEVEPLQQEHLDAVAHAGGLALLLVEFRSETPPYFNRYAIPWLLVPWKIKRTAESLEQVDIDVQWRVVETETCYLRRWHAGGPRSSIPRGRVFPR